MKQRKISARTKYEDYDDQKVLYVYLDYSLSKELCLNFIMLYRGLTSSLDIKFVDFSVLFTPNNEKTSHCLNLNVKGKKAELSISSNALGLIVNFLLKYFRDDIGEAKHIDLDFNLPSEKEFTLTLELDKFKMLSPKEIENLLDD